jgi:CDP-glucose 4,6-dehydratase
MATYQTNVMGTIHVLEAIRHQSGIRAAVIVTSDKCYENVEQEAGYREGDRLGGKDPYSASKAAAEIAFSSYARSFFTHGKTGIATARAGNVIGGGDWAKDRIVPDCIRAWRRKEKPVVRNPRSTRPWQHVLEPISGYLALGAALATGSDVHALAKDFSKVGTSTKNHILRGEAFNFGPRKDVNETVGSLIHELRKHWPMAREPKIEKNKSKPEAGLLQLDCTKARKFLGWSATLNFTETAAFTANWYRKFLENDGSTWKLTTNQIRYYVSLAHTRKMPWAN